MARKPNIGRAELEVLNYVTDHHPATVRAVADHLSGERGIVRTTVLNVMNRLCDKGYLSRRRVDGVFRYSPRVPKGELMRSLVRDFVERALGGSVSPFVAYLAEDARVGEEDMRQLKRLVEELEAQPRRKPE